MIRMTLDELLRAIDQAFIASLKEASMMITSNSEINLAMFQNAQIAAYNQGVMRMRRELLKVAEEVAERDNE